MSSPAAAAAIIYLGLDVHKDSITIAVVPMTAKNPTRLEHLPNDLPKLKRFLGRVRPTPVVRWPNWPDS